MHPTDLKAGVIIRGPVIPEPIQVVAVIPMGASTQLMGKGLATGQFHDPILSQEQIALLTARPETAPFDGIGVCPFRFGASLNHCPIFGVHFTAVVAANRARRIGYCRRFARRRQVSARNSRVISRK